MNGIVVDASIVFSWLFDDESSEIAEWVLRQMEAGVAIAVPSLWLLEMTNGLFKAERRKRIDRRRRDASLEKIQTWDFSILEAPTMADLTVLRHYADKHQLTAYDAEYLRVAKEHNLMLATLDGNLMAAAKREKLLFAGRG
jgi:predicted nucleic acid-binding protein